MGTFNVEVVRVDHVEHHPNADRLDIVTVKGFKSVVGRDTIVPGQIVVYIPEAALVPSYLTVVS